MADDEPVDLNAWATPPGPFRLSWTEEVLRDALKYARRIEERPYEIFLQGSYANETNIDESSDVDLVVLLKLPFEENVDALDAHDITNFNERYEQDPYGWRQFRAAVIASLKESFFVHEGDKTAGIQDWDSLVRVPADILPAIEYRLYSGFPSPGHEIYEEGVFFRNGAQQPIVNFPKQHLARGRKKDFDTGRRFKQVVRIVKRLRRWAIKNNEMTKATIPPYFIECFLYNVPDGIYRSDTPAQAADGAIECLYEWCHDDRPAFEALPCQNGLIPIFGDGPDQWEAGRGVSAIDALSEAWAKLPK
ncbi:nucleotidyltransferase [Actinoplanes sp. OR16]|uniref:nucleotidyltransferase domain-containing protein n=1 Tax=Actinoplanes sp. OR16 TaxID=946334 RepID=UPI000F6FB076|nr:nucleotidyltransferase domain-containing protein [Actinoplanes sp. OR16]BBH70715.1 nucleotidyltransferase [Actinoplanes sp. OR16]